MIFLFFASLLSADECAECANMFSHLRTLTAFENPAQSQKPLEFADMLFEKKLFVDAAFEYDRAVFSNENESSYDYARFQQALCAISATEYAAAGEMLDDLAYKALDRETAYRARLLRSIVFIAQNMPHQCEFALTDLARDFPDNNAEILFFRAWSRLLQYHTDKAVADFSQVCDAAKFDPFYFPRAYGTKRWLEINMPHVPMRSPQVARWLSSILPGSGQIYAGATSSGINSLAINAAFGSLTVSEIVAGSYLQGGVVFLFLWNRYYFGGIFNAERTAITQNRTEYDRAIYTLINTYLSENGAEPDFTIPDSESSQEFFNGATTVALGALWAYRSLVTKNDAQTCQFSLGCSDYSRTVFQHRNPLSAFALTSDRLLRCNPFAKHYYDVDSLGFLHDVLTATNDKH